MAFPFENLSVYQLAIEWVTEATQSAKAIKNSDLYPLADQLLRASTSIPLNIAEGNGRWHKGDKRQFFGIARGSVFECVAIMQAIRKQSIISEEIYRAAYEKLQSLAKMLTKLIQSVDGLQNSYLSPEG